MVSASLCAVTERTLVLIKPDGVERGLIGEVISRIERKGLSLAALELKTVSDDLARQHYAEHDGKPFFSSLLEFITSGPVVVAIVEGPRAVAAFRQIAGGTDPADAGQPGARVRFRPVRRARDRALVPGPVAADGRHWRPYGILAVGNQRRGVLGTRMTT
jgi:nucleoside-diphosphate kinase